LGMRANTLAGISKNILGGCILFTSIKYAS
jgi:hypothetical protein